jgi:uncharacterized protein with GYD domain
MPKYLLRASYTASGAAGLLREGGTGRLKAITTLVEGAGGKVESAYWVMGEDDFIMIADLPDVTAVAAASLTVGASGAAEVTTAELLTAAQVDEATKRRVDYRPPGG